MLPTLDARLTAAAELVLPGKPVADIGCDHGKLTAVLAASGKYPRVIGADLRPGPLAKAEQTLEHAGCKDRVELRLGDGLSVLSAGEVGTIVLAGVSARKLCGDCQSLALRERWHCAAMTERVRLLKSEVQLYGYNQ